MVKITFIEPDGTSKTVEATDGRSLMDAAVKNGIKGIQAECGGACSCATCHGYIEDNWIEKVGYAADDELDMLEFASDVQKNSRLCCQIKITSSLEGIIVRLPATQGM